MKYIGIIANENERRMPLKWYQFRNKSKPEYIYLKEHDVMLSVAYTDQNINKIFKKDNIIVAVCTEKCVNPKIENVYISDGKKLYEKYIPEIIKNVLSLSNFDELNRSLVIIDENIDVLSIIILQELYIQFKNITLITKNIEKAEIITEKILDEYGLALVISEDFSKSNADIAIRIRGKIPRLPKHSIVIDVNCENNIINKNLTINWISLATDFDLPFNIDSIALVDALEMICGKNLNFKIEDYKFNKYIIDKKLFSAKIKNIDI